MFALLPHTQSILIIVLVGLIVITLAVLAFSIHQTDRRIDRFFASTNSANSLEKELAELMMWYKNHEKVNALHTSEIKAMQETLTHTLQGVGFSRFQAFKDVGGQQSFASAFLAPNGTGIIISTLYSRERTSIFAKHIVAFKSDQPLTDEEAQVLEEARMSLGK